jgi:DNA mismatch repair protein MutS
LEDVRRVKGLVRRGVVRIITPGTVVEDALLPDNAQNLLASLVSNL